MNAANPSARRSSEVMAGDATSGSSGEVVRQEPAEHKTTEALSLRDVARRVDEPA